MSTQTKTEAVTITAPSAKITTALIVVSKAEASVDSAMLALIRSLQSEAKRTGYDAPQMRQLLTLSMREAKRGTKTGLPLKGETEEQIKAFDFSQKFIVSTYMTMAFPKAEGSRVDDVEKALKHDEAKNGQKHGRIGINRIKEIARGNLTFADAIAGKAPTRRNAAPPTPEAPDLSLEALENALAGIRAKFIKPGALQPEAVRTVALLVFCDGAYSPKK